MKKILSIIFIFYSLTLFGENLEDIKWITESYPPSNYIDEKGELKGFTVDILIEMWRVVGLNKAKSDILVYPWARGLHNLEKSNNICLFGMGINEKRMDKYSFVGRIPTVTRCLIAKKSKNYRFNSIEEFNSRISKSRIGAVRDDIGGEMFLNNGGKKDLLLYVSKGDQLVKMISAGRVDVIAFADIHFYKLLRKYGLNRSDYEIVYTYSKGISGAGYAFNKKTDPEVIKKLQSAFDILWKDGTVMRIRNKYLDAL